MNEKEKLIQILEELIPGVDTASEDKLVDDGILDSFDVVALIGEIKDAFGVQIGVNDLLPENFNSVDSIVLLIGRLR